MKTQFDIPRMQDIYASRDNYEVINLNPDDKRCTIFFSSHGIYYPNEERIFEEQIINKNRFEWKKNILTSVGKAIFVRDVTKQWYLTGINAEVNTIEKLCELLAAETKGFEVICIGSSAGGYAAALFGCLLNAARVLTFSAQFSLQDRLQTKSTRDENPTLTKYETEPEYCKYYSIVDIVANSKVPIFYFYPAKSQMDINQSALVADCDNVYQFAFNSSTHGKTCYLLNFIDLLASDAAKIQNIHDRYKRNSIDAFIFSVNVSGMPKTLKYLFDELLKKYVRRGNR